MKLRRGELSLLRHFRTVFVWFAVCLACLLPAHPAEAATPPRVLLIDCHDTLQPERADLFRDSLERARQQHFTAVLVNLTSPGGMTASVDRMVDAMRQSPLPIVVWAGESNSRVSGEALRILAEGDVALMTTTDYLTPLWTEVPRGLKPAQRTAGTQRLTVNLSRSVAAHGRSPWAIDELAGGVHWFNANDALQVGLIDGVARKRPDVLRFVTEHGIHKNGVTQQLDLSHAQIVVDAPPPQSALLLSLMNPNLCVLFCMLGLLLIYLEINTPGVILPGMAGVLLFLLSVYSLSRLPLTSGGCVLCSLAVILLALEAQTRRHGLFAAAGVVCLVFGLESLVNGPLPQLQVSWGTAAGAAVGFGGLTAALLILGVEARRSKIRTGSDAMLGWLAVAHTSLVPEGQILVRGELWKARLTSSDGAIAAGEQVKVLRADGLVLEVTAVPLAPPA